MARLPDEFIRQVGENVDLIALVSEYVRLEKRGSRLWGLCPFHAEKSPSFTVDPERGFFYCFGCKKGGSAIDFYMEMERATFREAVEGLAEKAGLALPCAPSESDDPEAAREKAARQDLLKRIAGTFHYLLMSSVEGSRALAYVRSRGVGDEAIERFSLGYAPKDRYWLKRFLKKKDYSDGFLASSGLFSANSPDAAFFANRLVFPIRDQKGNVLGFGARLLEGEGPKYLNSRETEFFRKGELLYGLDLALPTMKKSKCALVCEGYMDVIACHQAGIDRAIAPLGTAFTEYHARILRRWVDQVEFLFDSDDAGQNATDRGIEIALKAGIDVWIAAVSGHKDPAEAVQAGGAAALELALNARKTWMEYCIDKALRVYVIASPSGRSGAALYFRRFYDALDSALSKEAFLEYVTRRTGIDARAMKNDFSMMSERPRRKEESDGNGGPEPVHSSQDLSLMTAIALNLDHFPQVRKDVTSDSLEDEHARDLFYAMEDSFREGVFSLENVLSRVENDNIRLFVREKGASGEFDRNADRYINDGVRRIAMRRLERRRDELLLQIRTAMSSEASEEVSANDLLFEKMHLDSELAAMKDGRDERN